MADSRSCVKKKWLRKPTWDTVEVEWQKSEKTKWRRKPVGYSRGCVKKMADKDYTEAYGRGCVIKKLVEKAYIRGCMIYAAEWRRKKAHHVRKDKCEVAWPLLRLNDSCWVVNFIIHHLVTKHKTAKNLDLMLRGCVTESKMAPNLDHEWRIVTRLRDWRGTKWIFLGELIVPLHGNPN